MKNLFFTFNVAGVKEDEKKVIFEIEVKINLETSEQKKAEKRAAIIWESKHKAVGFFREEIQNNEACVLMFLNPSIHKEGAERQSKMILGEENFAPEIQDLLEESDDYDFVDLQIRYEYIKTFPLEV